MLAAALQLHRRKAIGVLAVCFALNLITNVVRGDPQPFLWLNAVINMLEVGMAGMLARRVCGAAMDLRRPRRLAAFALMAVAPAVLLGSLIIVGVATALHGYSITLSQFTLERYFTMEALGLFTVTPTLLLLARRHRFADAGQAGSIETVILMAVLATTATAVFAQSDAPLLFLIFAPLLVLVFRAAPSASALAVLMVTVIGGYATLTGHGPVTLTHLRDVPELDRVPELMRKLSVFYLFLLTIVAVALPVSTVVSERRRLVARLQQRTAAAHAARRAAEAADAAKSRFLALMSHEMRTPLHAVVGYSEILSRRPEMATDARSQLDEIQRSGDALLTLVEDVLEISRDQAIGCLDAARPSDLLAQAAAASQDAAATRGLTLTLEVAPDADHPVTVDRRRLRQALHKLIANAVKFTEAGGVRVGVEREGDLTAFRVTDTGSGIDPAMADRLFDAFVQADDSIGRSHMGAGLGLAVARRMVERMGGRLTLEQTSAAGSTFAIRLPLQAAELIDPVEDAASSGEPMAGRILVVDDHPANREVARLMLSPLGCEIVEAVDGQEAVALASVAAFDLILMDVRMPRMDGLEATRAIRALPSPYRATPILAVTADAMPEDAARCISAGMDGHLAKPITHAALFAAIDAVMAGSTDKEGAVAA